MSRNNPLQFFREINRVTRRFADAKREKKKQTCNTASSQFTNLYMCEQKKKRTKREDQKKNEDAKIKILSKLKPKPT